MTARSKAAAIAAACLMFPAAVASAAVHSSAAGTGPSFGVADDASKFADDGGATIYTSLLSGGLTETRWTATFDGDPTSIGDETFLDRSVPAAATAGVQVILSLFPKQAQAPDPTAFCQWVGTVATRYPTVTKFIVGNEVNATRFWSPQHTATDPNAGPNSYERTLAQCYDVLKAVNPNIEVIGMGLAPRSVSASSTKPLDFVRAVGAAFRASHRSTPIMDALAVHPYPNPNAKPPPAPDRAGYEDPGFYGISQLGRVKQAVYDAFRRTPQPTTQTGLRLVVDEVGYQSNETGNSKYTGAESSPTVSEQQQAAYYARVVQMYVCDPTIADVLFFHLVDEANLNVLPTSGGWQSGLEYPDGSPKPSFGAVQQAIAAGCSAGQVTWSPGHGKSKPPAHVTSGKKPKPRSKSHK